MMADNVAKTVKTRSWFRAWLHEFALHRAYGGCDTRGAAARLVDGKKMYVKPVPGTAGQWQGDDRTVDASQIEYIFDARAEAGY